MGKIVLQCFKIPDVILHQKNPEIQSNREKKIYVVKINILTFVVCKPIKTF